VLWARLKSVRGRLVLWYLTVLAILLLALGVFQSIILTNQLHSSIAGNMRRSARAELAVLGPCYIRSNADLLRNAQNLAQLLGSHDTAVKIVAANGATLADHGIGSPGASRPMRLSASTIRQLIASARSAASAPPSAVRAPRCQRPPFVYGLHSGPAGRPPPSLSTGNMLLTAILLGPWSKPVGFAILGQSLAETDATLRQVHTVFALGALIALVVAALVALPIINGTLRPLRRVAATAEAIAGGDLEKRANVDSSPDEIGRLGTAFDSMVDRLQAALFAATASEERMRRFLADASHELRTPLTVLRGSSQVLLRQGAGGRPAFDAALQEMHEEAVLLSRLVDDLLTLSRLDSGQPLDPQPVEVRDFLREFVDRYGTVWKGRTVALNDASIDGTVAYVDPEALRRVLTNLVDNAAKYSTPAGRIEIAARAQATTVTIAVSDEGPGLAPKDAERIFERFYRVSKSRSRQRGGTGLGLSIVHALVQQSGGFTAVETGADRGTTVSVTLPRLSHRT
jgi:two-component system OmpR family sensor kinase